MPQVAGELADLIPGSLTCWVDSVQMIAPDGHDWASSPDDVQKGRRFRITSVSPAPGTMAGQRDTVTVHGTVIESSDVALLPPATVPCSWLTADEIAQRNCQYLWIGLFQATSVPVDSVGAESADGVMSVGRSSSLPLWKIAPARTRATRCGALTARQRACAASISL